LKIKKYAAIDIGSNAMRVLISNVVETKQKVHFQGAPFPLSETRQKL
jgi:exopolyphosphatase/pppGpp-phosphohydrolase